ncbi:hypothetical protein, conserved [Eimeria maxima]|uniref:Uncharacterized protein n=1 Tax=Eimeria maxima TaxID=5804 RepID=U6M1Y5_EIMMA|nr:hypothetical protein, conserved [Eimeria maxima]CDJ56474.1 hypothetical protein, conserved [Eimeria maxima]
MLRAAANAIRCRGALGAPLRASLPLELFAGAPGTIWDRRGYMGPRRWPGSSSSSSSGISSSVGSDSSSSSRKSSSSSTFPPASFSIFGLTSMVTIKPSPPTLDTVNVGGPQAGAPQGGPQGGGPQTFTREGGIVFSFLPKLATQKTFDKSGRLTVLLKAKHIGYLLGGPPGGPLEGDGGPLEAPCGLSMGF